MPLASYKDLCIDAGDAQALAEFYSAVLGWEASHLDDGDSCLRDGDHVMVWVNSVEEPVTVKNRLHLDVFAESVATVVERGAKVVDDTHPWTVVRDPDGQVLCVFEREGAITRRLYELVLDVSGGTDEAHRLAQWWADVLGSESGHNDDFSWVEPVAGAPFESIVFVPVPEEKTAKNRVHIDVTTDALGRLVAAGAIPLRDKGDKGIGWYVMSDPAGNEFCAFTHD